MIIRALIKTSKAKIKQEREQVTGVGGIALVGQTVGSLFSDS